MAIESVLKPPTIIPVRPPRAVTPQPPVSRGEVFNRMARPVVQSCGFLKNRDAFSRSLMGVRDFVQNYDRSVEQEFRTTMYIKLPDTPIVLHPILSQFAELVERIAKMRYGPSLRDFRGETVGINISQRFLEKGEFSTFVGRHIDGYYEDIYCDVVQARDLFIVSDNVPTVFYTGDLDIHPVFDYLEGQLSYEQLAHDIPEGIDREADRILSEQSFCMKAQSGQPYEIMRYSDFDIHEAQIADRPMWRTLVSLVFTPSLLKEWRVVGEINNPCLEAYRQSPERVVSQSRVLSL